MGRRERKIEPGMRTSYGLVGQDGCLGENVLMDSKIVLNAIAWTKCKKFGVAEIEGLPNEAVLVVLYYFKTKRPPIEKSIPMLLILPNGEKCALAWNSLLHRFDVTGDYNFLLKNYFYIIYVLHRFWWDMDEGFEKGM